MDVPLSWVGDHSGWVVVLFIIWALITDKIVWHKRLDEKQAEADQWRTSSQSKDQTISELTTHVGLLKETAANVLAIMRSLRDHADRNHRGDL